MTAGAQDQQVDKPVLGRDEGLAELPLGGDVAPRADDLDGRSVLVKRLRPIPIECVARGYLAGSGWKEYRADGAVCGIPLRRG